ncbi:MAG TPA: FlgD immunoglobulin-like domain containing protein, partial [Bacteroidota bacterium]
LIPAAFGLAGVNLHTYTGWGSIPYWNAFVANLEMHGKGTFFDPRLDDATQFPIAAKNKFGHKQDAQDLITAKLPALHAYQLSLGSPKPPDSLFDHAAADRGDALFGGKAKCTTCHTDELYTEPGWNMHKGSEIGIDDFQANRSPEKAYRTTPLKGLWAHMKGGFFHDGRFATLKDVVDHYNTFFSLGLSAGEESDLVEYLKSLGDVPVSLTTTQVKQLTGTEPNRFVLSQNYPNPFNPSTVIQYELGKAANVRLDIYSVTGQLVRSLVSGQEQAGLHTVTWNGTNGHGEQVATGVYLYRLQAGTQVESKKMLLMK